MVKKEPYKLVQWFLSYNNHTNRQTDANSQYKTEINKYTVLKRIFNFKSTSYFKNNSPKSNIFLQSYLTLF